MQSIRIPKIARRHPHPCGPDKWKVKEFPNELIEPLNINEFSAWQEASQKEEWEAWGQKGGGGQEMNKLIRFSENNINIALCFFYTFYQTIPYIIWSF